MKIEYPHTEASRSMITNLDEEHVLLDGHGLRLHPRLAGYLCRGGEHTLPFFHRPLPHGSQLSHELEKEKQLSLTQFGRAKITSPIIGYRSALGVSCV